VKGWSYIFSLDSAARLDNLNQCHTRLNSDRLSCFEYDQEYYLLAQKFPHLGHAIPTKHARMLSSSLKCEIPKLGCVYKGGAHPALLRLAYMRSIIYKKLTSFPKCLASSNNSNSRLTILRLCKVPPSFFISLCPSVTKPRRSYHQASRCLQWSWNICEPFPIKRSSSIY
jgi:hypothetical protein